MKKLGYPQEEFPEKPKKILYNPDDDGRIEYQRTDGIILAQEANETKIAVRLKDLERIKRQLEKEMKSKNSLSILYSVLYGISVSAGLSIIPFAIAASIPPWVIPLYICICIFSLIAAIGINIIDSRLARNNRNIEIEALTEIDEVIQLCIGE